VKAEHRWGIGPHLGGSGRVVCVSVTQSVEARAAIFGGERYVEVSVFGEGSGSSHSGDPAATRIAQCALSTQLGV